MPLPDLPVTQILDDLRDALLDATRVVLQAPPGAGKTTLVPLALRSASWLSDQRILMLEPRRLAARAAARRMASLLGEEVGDTVGFRVRRESVVSARTRIEVVTEGILTRMLATDPTLDGVGCVIFDEFHERSLQGDLGLALTLQTQELVRPDLRVIVMSATLAAERIAELLGNAPVIRSEGRAYPVRVLYRPPRDGQRLEGAVASAVRTALQEETGDVLAFLPGQGEIARTMDALRDLPPGVTLHPLFGNLSAREQDLAVLPATDGSRRIVLATAIAESSLTIDGVRVVVDSGRSRIPRYSARTGMTRLDTVRVSRASADQRAGRAGRVAPGVCYRLWPEEEQGHLLPFSTPEILEADLAPLALELAVAGVEDPAALSWMDPPPAGALARAREVLRELGALDDTHRVTPFGRRLVGLGTHPRFGTLLLGHSTDADTALACDLVALLEERDPLQPDGPPDVAPFDADIRVRLDLIRRARRGERLPVVLEGMRVRADAVRRIVEAARSWRRVMKLGERSEWIEKDHTGMLLVRAWPDRLAQRRSNGRFVMRLGSGALFRDSAALAQSDWVAIAETDGRASDATIRMAAPLTEDEVRHVFAAQLRQEDRVEWDSDSQRVRVTRVEQLGALVLRQHSVPPRPEHVRQALKEAAATGRCRPGWNEAATSLRQRLAFLHAHQPGWPDVSEAAMAGHLAAWLDRELADASTPDARQPDLTHLLHGMLDWRQRAQLDELAPSHFAAPTGSRLPVDYTDSAAPVVRVRLQEMFGLDVTPALLDGRVPLTLHLLSPAHRPVQITRDLPGFWRSSYADVKRELKGRYPRHPWPDDPRAATPTRRAKPR